jgi:hypothetical protein
MPRTPLPPLAAVVSFIDCINRGDVDALAKLMTADHRLIVLDEPPLTGRAQNVTAWKGYASAFPRYVIYPGTSSPTGRALPCSDSRPAPTSASPITRR